MTSGMTFVAQVKSGRTIEQRKSAMREMIASRSLGRAGISAMVPYIAVLCVALLTGCTKFTDLQSPQSLRTPKPLATSEIPVVNWSEARQVHMLATEFAFSPNDPVFKAGVPYRLVIRNVGDNEHVLKGSHFLRAIAVHQVKLTEFTSHGNDGHGDKAIGPDKSDGVPKLPPLKKGTRDLVAENNAEAIAEAKAGNSGNSGKEAADPFAATNAEEDGEEDGDEEAGDGDGDSTDEAANPFAAKDEGDADEDAGEAANPFAAKPEGESEDDDVSEDQANDDQDSDEQVEDKVTGKSDTGSDEDDDKSKVQKTPAEEADDDDDVVVTKVAAPAKPAVKQEIDWQPLDINRIAIPVGHEVSIEFVAVRTGTYRFHSVELKYALSGMFGEAKIE
jgi:hypothetical protein